MPTLTYTERLYVQECCSCGIPFGMPSSLDSQLRESHRSFYCPNGHSQSYTGPTEAEKERKRAAELERRLASREDDLRAAELERRLASREDDLRVERERRDAERRAHAATKGQLTKARNRADRGVCQHCNRSFVNVAKHVATKHMEALTHA